MNHEPLDQMRRWLAAEERGDSEAADRAFFDVFRLLPRIPPSPAGSARVLEAALDSLPALRGRAWGSIWLRPLIGAALALAGLAALGTATALPVPTLSAVIGVWVSAVTAGAVWLSRALDVGLSAWALCGNLGEAAGLVAATPTVSLMLACNGLVALVAFCGLRWLLGPPEEMASW